VQSGYRNIAPGLAFEKTISTTGTRSAPEPAPPALEWARVNGAELALRFDKALDGSSSPAASAFAVSVAGSARSASAVAESQDTVPLTLASAVAARGGDGGLHAAVGQPAAGRRGRRGGGGVLRAGGREQHVAVPARGAPRG